MYSKRKVNQFDKNGERCGYWEVYILGKIWYKGWYLNGKMHGYYEEYEDDGEIDFKGWYIDGKIYGGLMRNYNCISTFHYYFKGHRKYQIYLTSNNRMIL